VDLFLSFCRYDQTDQGIQSHIMQHIISSKMNGHHTLFIEEVLVQKHEAYNKLHVFQFLTLLFNCCLLFNFLVSFFCYFLMRSFLFCF